LTIVSPVVKILSLGRLFILRLGITTLSATNAVRCTEIKRGVGLLPKRQRLLKINDEDVRLSGNLEGRRWRWWRCKPILFLCAIWSAMDCSWFFDFKCENKWLAPAAIMFWLAICVMAGTRF
jgi:hypothetical protein